MSLICFSFVPSDLAVLLMFTVYTLSEGFPSHRHGERYLPWDPLPTHPGCQPNLQAAEVPNSSVLSSGPTRLQPLHCIFPAASGALLLYLFCAGPPVIFFLYTLPAASPSNGFNSRPWL